MSTKTLNTKFEPPGCCEGSVTTYANGQQTYTHTSDCWNKLPDQLADSPTDDVEKFRQRAYWFYIGAAITAAFLIALNIGIARERQRDVEAGVGRFVANPTNGLVSFTYGRP